MVNAAQSTIATIRGTLTAVVVVLLLGNAVALRAIEPTAEGGTRGSASEAPISDVAGVTAPSPGPTPTAPDGATGSGAAATTTTTLKASKGEAAPVPTTSPPPPAMPKQGYTFKVTVSPLCVQSGAPLTVTMHLRPGRSGSLIAAYADGHNHGTRYGGPPGPDGVLTWTGPAAPVVGTAYMLTSSTDDDGRGGGTMVEFRVVAAEELC